MPSRRNPVDQIVPKARGRHGETPSPRSFQRSGAVTEKPRRPDRSKGAGPSRRNPVDQIVPKARGRHGETPSTRSFQRRGAVTEKPRRPDRSKGAGPSRRNPVDQIVPKARCRHGETPSTRSFQRRGAVTEKPRRPDRSISWRGTVSRWLWAERSRRPGVYSEIMSIVYAGARSCHANLVVDSLSDRQPVKRIELTTQHFHSPVWM